jgi:ABC-2 type transport system ATP-binding protein
MKEHAAKGNIVFFSSHIIDVVEKICDKIAIIKKGKIRAAASVAELEARNMDLEQFYLDIIYAEEDAPLVSIDGDDILGICADSAKVGGNKA